MDTNTAVPIIVRLIMSVGGQKVGQSMFSEISRSGNRGNSQLHPTSHRVTM